jgi:hypothetical protein
MLGFLILSAVFVGILFLCIAIGRSVEVMANWERYRRDPLIVIMAFLFKPDSDPRSRWEFADDNFKEVAGEMVADATKMMVAPLFHVFYMMLNSIVQGIQGLVNIRDITTTMHNSFSEVFGIFLRRFGATLHQFRMTFHRVETAFQRVWAVAMNSVWQSLTLIQGIYSMYDLMVKITLVLLAILVAVVIFLFMFAWGIIPLIIMAISFLASAGVATGGFASVFCFGPDAAVVMQDGKQTPIASLKLGDILLDGGVVTGVFEFDNRAADAETLLDAWGIPVSGSHIYYDPSGVPMHVRDIPGLHDADKQPTKVYCLNTTTHRIPVATATGRVAWFSDWEELEDDEGVQMEWNRTVFEALNPGSVWNPNMAFIHAEAVLPASTLIRTDVSTVMPISDIVPGMMVLNAEGVPTRVTGIARLVTPNAVAAVWSKEAHTNVWQQVQIPDYIPGSIGYAIFTESGTFQTESGASVRDFTDIGASNIASTYSWVLEHLRSKNFTPTK